MSDDHKASIAVPLLAMGDDGSGSVASDDRTSAVCPPSVRCLPLFAACPSAFTFRCVACALMECACGACALHVWRVVRADEPAMGGEPISILLLILTQVSLRSLRCGVQVPVR